MSRWRFRLRLESGLTLLQGNSAAYKWSAVGPQIQVDVSAGGGSSSPEASVFGALLQALRAQSFTVSGEGGAVEPVPAPWRAWAKSDATPAPNELLAAELALELWLLPSREINDFDAIRQTLEARRCHLSEDVREALAYWLLGSTHSLGGRPDLKKSWRSDVAEVLVMRSPDWTSRRRPSEPLLAAAQSLLEELTRLRNAAVTLADFEALVAALEVKIPPLPDAFRQTIWWEAGYQLAARGLHQEANRATERYKQACESLLARLPGLAEGGIPGFGVSVGQRAYYAGEFRLALEAYRTEWDSGSEPHRSRLKRLIANVFNDLGALSAAQRLAEEALCRQEEAGDPEVYKTLGRCGEIALRSGHLERAADYYRRSHEVQQALLGAQSVSGQTAVYRGHVALLAGHLEEAARWYVEAHRADALKDSRLNAYALMGEAALALRHNDHAAALACLDRLEKTDPAAISGDALPRAIIALAAVAAGAPRDKGVAAIEALLKNNYMVEALVLLPLVYRQLGMASKVINRIADALRQWDEALLALPELAGERADSDPTPNVFLAALEAARKRESWVPLTTLGPRIFPASLLLRP